MQIPNFNSLTIVSLLAAVMSISYSTIAIGASIAAGRQPDAYYNMNGLSTSDQVFGETLVRRLCPALVGIKQCAGSPCPHLTQAQSKGGPCIRGV